MTDTSSSASSPATLDNVRVVLVQTFHPGNIGATARAILTMGIKDLVLVNPRCFPDEEATRMASGAAELLENARVVERLEDAVNDCQLVIGASARLRSLPLPHFDEPSELLFSYNEKCELNVAWRQLIIINIFNILFNRKQFCNSRPNE